VVGVWSRGVPKRAAERGSRKPPWARREEVIADLLQREARPWLLSLDVRGCFGREGGEAHERASRAFVNKVRS